VTTGEGSHPYQQAPGPEDENRSVGDIVGSIAKDLGTLMRQELELAKTEAKDEAKKAGKGAGMLGAAGVAGHLLLIFISLFVMFVLENWMGFEWASLIVAVIWAIVAAVLARKGRSQLKNVDPKLETTTQTLKEDAQWASNRSKS
jgi:uncharacterized membrane protein YqjE